MLWDIPLGVGTRICRGGRGGVANVEWSPNGRHVFAGNVAPVFHVWDTERWNCEHWRNVNGRCKVIMFLDVMTLTIILRDLQNACWSGDGDVLLFALQRDPSLYYITFRGVQAASQLSTAIKCADLSPCELSHAGQKIM